MFETPHYHAIIKKVIIGFGNLFSNMQIQRFNEIGSLVQTVAVPIAYGPKEKWNVRVDQDPELENEVYTTIPRMGFEITGYNYDSSRMVNRNQTIKCFDADSNGTQVFAPVPYNLDISLYIQTKGTEDSLTVLEQILPIFAPEYNLSLNAIPSLNLKQDVPIILQGVSVQDDYEGDFQTRRLVTHTLNFTAKISLYGPVKNKGIITSVQANVTTDSTTPVYDATGNPANGAVTENWNFE